MLFGVSMGGSRKPLAPRLLDWRPHALSGRPAFRVEGRIPTISAHMSADDPGGLRAYARDPRGSSF